ncbi:uncharacterized protein EV154DRAFT_565787 [Mucor mucedo]|uniref:uncharacterized protein n=1 Tax=Mucor mucedo TaxID=29922 RepID=UPI0022208879|nr:uncharacterized protein EV154DRAFT_565787 [Mucor mucedo]KAI7889014.1 hypothetical protein EV154DRAFT_565787 [Mucor mucedo]
MSNHTNRFHNLVELNAEIRDQALSCNVCQYNTDRRSNHTRHLNSESHRLNVANAILSNANNPNEVQNEAMNTDPSPEVQDEADNSMNIDSPSGSPMMTDIDVEPEPEPDITPEEAFGSSHGFEEDDSEIGRDFDPFENILNDEVQLDGGPGVSESINPNTNDDEPQVPDDQFGNTKINFLDPTDTDYDFKGYPTPQGISRFYKSTKSTVPILPHAEYYVKSREGIPYTTPIDHSSRDAAGKPYKPDLIINHVSEHLRLLIANPIMSPYLSDLPDYTSNQRIKLGQGKKWIEDKLFQPPMIIAGNDNNPRQLWVSDRISRLSDINVPVQQRPYFKVFKFFQESNIVKAFLFPVITKMNDSMYYLSEKVVSCDVSQLNLDDVCRLEVEDYQAYTSVMQNSTPERLIICNPSYTIDNTNLIRDHYNMIKAANDHKHPLPVNSNFVNNVLNPSIPKNFQVVRVVPYNLFSDDTSGNSTSKWNCFDTWSMNPAAVPLSIANHYLNQLLLCGSNKLSAMEQLPSLVESASGAAMPIITIQNIRTTPEEYVSAPREKRHWESLFITSNLPIPDFSIRVRDRQGNFIFVDDLMTLGFKDSNGKGLLGLSSWDPSKDTPVEILHGLCLGLIKYTFNKAADCFINKTQVDVISSLCRTYGSKAFTNLSTHLKGYKSYLGGDFKLMVQMIPIVLRLAKDDRAFLTFRNDPHHRLNNIIDTFDKLGELCSLSYMSEIHTNFDKFVEMLRKAANDTIVALDNLDHTAIPSSRRSRRGRRDNQASTTENVDEPSVMFGDVVPPEEGEDSDDEDVTSAAATGAAATGARAGVRSRAGASSGEQLNGASIPYAKTGGPLCNRLKTHLIIHLVEDCIRFASPVLLATEKNEQFNKYIRAIIMKTNKQNPSRDLALINGRELSLRNVAMGCYWDNDAKTCGSKVVLKRGDLVELEVYTLVEKPVQVLSDNASIFTNYQVDDGGNLLAVKLDETLSTLVFKLAVVELLDMSHSTVINDVQYSIINKCKFGTLWWFHNTDRHFEMLKNDSQD